MVLQALNCAKTGGGITDIIGLFRRQKDGAITSLRERHIILTRADAKKKTERMLRLSYSYYNFLYQHSYRVFQETFQGSQETGAYCSIYASVVAAEGQFHDVGRFYLPFFHYRSFGDITNRKDR